MSLHTTPKQPFVLSYRGLRKAVGIIAVTLPFVLAIGKWVTLGSIIAGSPGLQTSISGYYYTDMRNIFVGSLCAISIFLVATWGYNLADAIAGRIAAVFAFGVAWFPTKPDQGASDAQKLIAKFHAGFATSLFLILAFFCIFQFTQSEAPKERQTPQKRQRNFCYYLCGGIILACIAGCGIATLMDKSIFWFESIAVFTFGVAWLIKGEMLLKDAEPPHQETAHEELQLGPNWHPGGPSSPAPNN
jgi:hypothetical protein